MKTKISFKSLAKTIVYLLNEKNVSEEYKNLVYEMIALDYTTDYKMAKTSDYILMISQLNNKEDK